MAGTLAGRSIGSLAAALRHGDVTSRELTEAALASVARDGTAFTRVYPDRARAEAAAADARLARGGDAPALCGIPVSIKDLFDVAGEPTPAGSVILRDAPPAKVDAPVVARLRAAGAVIVGRTQMSEFAFSGLGTNPHWPRVVNPVDATRVPGGSSSGAVVSVARGQAALAIGTDTGGSVRIPAAFCGLTGFKPTQRRVSRAGAFPLAGSLDSVGPIAASVACCVEADAAIADTRLQTHAPLPASALRLAVPVAFVLAELDPAVSAAFERALRALGRAGARIELLPFGELLRIPEINARGTLANAEAYEYHAKTGLLAHRARYDANVLARIDTGARLTPDDRARLVAERARLIRDVDALTTACDALVFPAVATVAPRFADIESPADWSRVNALTLRNASVVNLLDRCAVSIPMHAPGELPSGLMVVGETMGDARLLSVAAAVEAALAEIRSP